MPIHNSHWQNRNEGIAYPLADSATALADDGSRLPSNIISDLNLRWPLSYGRHAFLASASVTPTLVTLTFQAAATLESADFVPLAVISIVGRLDEGRVYTLQAQAPGVGGWVSFGSAASDHETWRGRFSTPAQALLAARAARAYRELPVKSLRVENASTPLAGVVTLRLDPPLTATAEQREIRGVVRDCIVIRLEETGNNRVPAETAQLLPATQSVFASFAGPCGGRPESGTCDDPQPVEFVGGVMPDCDGLLTIEFQGCATLARLDGRCGVAVSCLAGVGNACLPGRLPDAEGNLPADVVAADIPVPDDEEEEITYESESHASHEDLPQIECFDAGAIDFSVKSGSWGIDGDDSPYDPCNDGNSDSVSGDRVVAAYVSLDPSRRNVSIWEGFDTSTTYRRVSTDFSMASGPAGILHNGGIVLNYRAHDDIAGQFTWHLVSVDYDAQRLTIQKWNGSGIQEVTHVNVPGIILNRWYRLTVTITPLGETGQTQITATLLSVYDDGVDVTLSAPISGYRPSDGYFGLHANRAVTRFSYFMVEEAN